MQVLALLEDADKRLAEAGARVLARAGHVMGLSEGAGALDRARGRLLTLAREGPAKAAKASVQCALMRPASIQSGPVSGSGLCDQVGTHGASLHLPS